MGISVIDTNEKNTADQRGMLVTDRKNTARAIV
jgi:hypothetical protein